MSSPAENGSAPQAFSKKVFFLYPHSVIQEQLITILVQAEYEVALVNSHDRLKNLVQKYPSSIVFCNVDDTHLGAEEWEAFIKGLLEQRDKTDVRIGVMTYNPDPGLAQKYLMDYGITCGYIGLKLGLAESTKIILRTLEANEAKGGRRFVRVKAPIGKSVISISNFGQLYKGNILDLSSAGLACTFEVQPKLKNGQTINDVQLTLWGGIVRVSLSFMGTREQAGQGLIYVMLFESFSDRESKAKLYTYIRKAIQLEIDNC